MTPEPQPSQQVQLPPLKQVVLPPEATFVNVDPQPGGVLVRITCLASGEAFLLQLAEEAAQTIGKQLTAPRVAVPPGAMNGGGAH